MLSPFFHRYLTPPAMTSHMVRCSRAYMHLHTLGANQGSSYTTAGLPRSPGKFRLLSNSSNNSSNLALTTIPTATLPSTLPAVWTVRQGQTCPSHL